MYLNKHATNIFDKLLTKMWINCEEKKERKY